MRYPPNSCLHGSPTPTFLLLLPPLLSSSLLLMQNFWIKLAIIVGAVLIFLYMILCAFHRKLMAPSKHRPTTP